MPIIASFTKNDFTPAPEGLHRAVCVDVVDLGMQPTKEWGEKHMVQIRWFIEERDPKSDKPFLVMSRYTLSLGKKARLRQNLEAWRGKKFTEEELAGFDLENLIGVNCQLQIVHNVKEDTTYANVQVIVPAPKGVPPLPIPSDYVRVCDRPEQQQQQRMPSPEEEDDRVPF